MDTDYLDKVSKDEILREKLRAIELYRIDQNSREEAYEDGIEKGILEVAKKLLDILDDETIATKTGLAVEKIRELRNGK